MIFLAGYVCGIVSIVVLMIAGATILLCACGGDPRHAKIDR